MDLYLEQLVKGKTGSKAAKAGVLALAAVLILVSFFSIAYIGILVFVLWAGIVYGAYLIITGQNVEYEYTLTGEVFQVDKIIAKRKRKCLISMGSRNFEIIAPLKYEKDFQNQRIDVTINAAGDKSGEYYFAVFVLEKQRYKLIFEPCEEMKKALSMLNTSKFRRSYD